MAGLKYGRQANGKDGFGEATASTIMLGYMFDRPVYHDGTGAIEFEFTNTVDNGDITDPSGHPNGVWANDSSSLFFAYRTPGTVYFKAKAGVTVADRYISMPSHPRFHDQEQANDPEFAKALARLAEVYVNDAFAVSHRAHASVVGVPSFLEECAAGFLLKNEITYFEKAM
ncbi:MAG: phosphoglycerate kinase, partial [Gammaproteobacteria bacterium]